MDRKKIAKNKYYLLLILCYTVLLLIVSTIAGYFAYLRHREEILSQTDKVLESLADEYQEITDNFWSVYMPVFESQSIVLSDYFTTDLDWEQYPLKKRELSQIMKQMIRSDNRIQWIAFYTEARKQNYIYFRINEDLQILSEEFPYRKQLKQGESRMEIWGMQELEVDGFTVDTFAISGGIPFSMGEGHIMAGYDISSFEKICQKMPEEIESLSYMLICNNEILYASNGDYDQEPLQTQEQAGGKDTAVCRENGQYIKYMVCGTNESLLYYKASWWELLRYMHRDTLFLFLIMAVFSVSAVFLYLMMNRLIIREIEVIGYGLAQIGENHLDYRISNDFRQSGLPEIADAINQMAGRLNENINRVYYYQLKQREVELSELQAKFNPHFLYNSLEMLRSRCLKSGDDKTANLIAQLASIFRGFIGGKTFIPLTEELAFSNRYLALFGARYDDSVEVLFDVDSDLLKYGTIRNLFQPLIENYYTHGYDISEPANYLMIGGKSLDERRMLLFVEDNGCGMPEEEIRQWNMRFREPIQVDTQSYGLKNLYQRIRLFYGEDCGLKIFLNGEKGLRVEMTLRKITCEEYDRSHTGK